MACAISELLGDLDGILLSSPDSCNTDLLQSYALGIVFISLTIQGSRYGVIFIISLSAYAIISLISLANHILWVLNSLRARTKFLRQEKHVHIKQFQISLLLKDQELVFCCFFFRKIFIDNFLGKNIPDHQLDDSQHLRSKKMVIFSTHNTCFGTWVSVD